MISRSDSRMASLQIVNIDVEADNIFDLRDGDALAKAGVDVADAVASWQDVVKAGGIPRSWKVRDRLLKLGANGLIDPSRKRPGLWHLVLFRWNDAGGPRVKVHKSERE